MCGISGFTDFNKRTDQAVLKKMNRMPAHRGLDAEYETTGINKADINNKRLKPSVFNSSFARLWSMPAIAGLINNPDHL